MGSKRLEFDSVCLFGAFITGTHADMRRYCEQLGINTKTNYLVIGERRGCNQDRVSVSNQIKKAQLVRAYGAQFSVMLEREWFKHLHCMSMGVIKKCTDR